MGAYMPRSNLRYQHVYDYVLELISRQGLSEGDRLPSATALAEETGVSMISVRRGLTELEREGKITRHQGLGTFVGGARVIAAASQSGGLLGTLVVDGTDAELHTKVLSIDIGRASENLARALSLQPGEPVWDVRRLRTLRANVRILDRAVMPVVKVPAIDEGYLHAGKSLYAFLQKEYGLEDASSEQALEVVTPSPSEARLLKITRADPILRVRGVSFDGSGGAFDCYEQIYQAMGVAFYIGRSEGRPKTIASGLDGDWSVESLRVE